MNTKRILAVALSTAMVFGSTLTAFATELDPTAASGSGTGTGAGTSEGYVGTTITKVLVPTEESVAAGIAFKVDPQGLIAGTDAAAYNGYTFPESNDTGVYFQTGAKEYSNESGTFYVANEGTGDVTFTIKVEKVANTAGSDIPFDSKANVTAANPSAVKLYIGALIGKDATATAVSDDTAVEKKAVLEAVSENFDFDYGADGYEFVTLSGSKWNAVPIKFEGAVTKLGVADAELFKDKTVPGIKLTYSWAAKASGDSTTSGVTIDDTFEDSAAGGESTLTISNATKVTGQAWDYTATFRKGTALTMAATGLTEATWSKTVDGSYATSSNITVSNGAVTIAASNWGSANAGDVRFIKVKISGTDYIIKITIA
ncbi:hypothetical protein [Butyrivibrio sp. M55]|uniref:hypothetical protein n=1 Tax=Butyrivibrio sp. M55 TaxID=1855323 RepID=UPI0008DECACF|nr:hypothetical protein [Butyrivibrio sp. M55]SFU66132.1 hypothetical protein SAMN05216540_105161 [Butyrivibrio sp. M55]